MNYVNKIAGCAIAAFAMTSAFASEDELPGIGEKDADSAEEIKLAQLNDGEEAFGGGVIKDVSLDDGSRFVFLDVAGGVGILEETPSGGRMIQDHDELRGATLIDLFLAVTEPGTSIPEQIRSVSKPSRMARAQGWARNLSADEGGQTRANMCNNSTFSNAVVSTGYNDRGTPSLRLDKRVGSTGYFDQYTYCGGTSWPGGCPTFHRYKVGNNIGSTWYNVDKYYTLVSVCGLGVHPTLTSNYGWTWVHPGPRVSVQYRNSNNSPWAEIYAKDFSAGDVGKTAGWHWYNGAQSGWNFDWRTQIEYAEINDRFDIGHAVEDLGY